MMTRYMGIDPGDRWVGWCKLRTDGSSYEASMGVVDRNLAAFTTTVDNLVPRAFTKVVCESFQVRPLGHNRFSALETPQYIGALKYAMLKENHLWSEVNQGSPKDLEKYPIYRYIKEWQLVWPTPRDEHWQHALSAWRILCHYMMSMHLKHLANLAVPKKVPTLLVINNPVGYLVSPVVSWTIKPYLPPCT